MAARALAGLFLLCASAIAGAQDYPAKPIHLVVPFPPGGGNDTVARAIAQQMGPALGQPVVIDNRPGAGGSVGAEAVATAIRSFSPASAATRRIRTCTPGCRTTRSGTSRPSRSSPRRLRCWW
jgi:tripartite-type tricarboxylate transporter receptor subunit TctC